MLSEDNIQALHLPGSIARLMVRLLESRALLILMSGDGALERQFRPRAVDVDRGLLVIDPLVGGEGASFEGWGEIHAKAVIDGIQTWFTVTGVVHEQGKAVHQLRFPEIVYRLQRRAALRVRPSQARAGVHFADEGRVLSGTLHDISTTGVCFRFPRANAALFDAGTEFDRADIRCDCGLNLQVPLKVANLRSEEGGAVLVGMRFVALSPAEQRAIERAVLLMQREMLAQG